MGFSSRRLTAEQRMAVESLPSIQANEAGVLGVHLAVAGLYRSAARALANEVGAEWPSELGEAVLDHLRRCTVTDFAP